jgi:hypothetical protein
MLARRVSAKAVAPRAAGVLATSQARGIFFQDAKRRPQLSAEEREKVVIDQSQWPEAFKDWDPKDPYKNIPDWINGMGTSDWCLFGAEIAFIVVFWECCFPNTVAL